MTTTLYRDQVLAEIATLPDEYLPLLLQVVQTFRASVTLPHAADSFRQGWREVLRGETYPLAELWDGIDDA